jgi:NAD(P) transhydrogenase subunit alpha
MKFSGLTVGIPKEIMRGEMRVAAIPETVTKFKLNGAKVLVEAGAGIGSGFCDGKYTEAGAVIVSGPLKLYSEADIILKIKEPMFSPIAQKDEADMLREGQYLIAFLYPSNYSNHEMIRKLAENGVISFTLDGMPRVQRARCMDALYSMSTIVGYKSVIMAADRLTKFMPMMGTTVGMIKPASVVVVGAGAAGLQAVATAKRIGAVVTGIDLRKEAADQVRALGAIGVELEVPEELYYDGGDEWAPLSEEWLGRIREKIAPIVKTADVLILSALFPGRPAPVLITRDMVKSMQNGSVIIDIAVNQGGNCELTVPGESCEPYGVFIDGTKNIPGMMPASSTFLFAHNAYNFMEYLASEGRLSLDKNDIIIKSTLTTFGRQIEHAGARAAMGL